MTTVLVTGFDPFGGEKVNPAYEAVRMLPDRIAGARVITLEIPTAFTRGPAAVERAIERERPDIVISVGQAGGRSAITVEKVAVNLAEARIPDNDGEQPMGVALREDGDAAYFATIPVEAMVMNVRDHGLPAFVSYTAGTYVCNSVMYHMLYLLDRRFPGVRGGFIHVPCAIGQTVDKPNGTPSMSLPDMAKALEYAIEAAVGGGAGDGESGRAVMGGDPLNACVRHVKAASANRPSMIGMVTGAVFFVRTQVCARCRGMRFTAGRAWCVSFPVCG